MRPQPREPDATANGPIVLAAVFADLARETGVAQVVGRKCGFDFRCPLVATEFGQIRKEYPKTKCPGNF